LALWRIYNVLIYPQAASLTSASGTHGSFARIRRPQKKVRQRQVAC
jgi:hypothetical protein